LIPIALLLVAGAAQFELPKTTFLIDETIPIVVSGLTPATDVTIRLTTSSWASTATFTADSQGIVDVTRMAPKQANYTGVDAMGLFWSAERSTAPPAPSSPLPITDISPQSWQLTAEVQGATVATITVLRRAVAEDVAVRVVRERGIIGVFYQPPGATRHPAVIVLGGSGGGVTPASSFPGGLASRGYAVLALAYFGVEGLPPSLSRIPLEYFETAFDWLVTQPSVDPAHIGVLGGSRGAELALLLAAIDSRIRAVVAYMPSNVVWAGCCDRRDEPSWTINGRALVWVRPGDGVWHSTEMGNAIINRLKQNHFTHAFTHLVYDNAGHAIGRPFTPTTDIANVRHPLTGRIIHLGGTPAGTAHAREDSWPRTLSFLDEQLH
jgi:dienelactone hydrolase